MVGTMGEVPHAILLVENEDDVAKLTLPADAKVAYLTQTTLSVDETTGSSRRCEASIRRSSARRSRTSATRPRTARRR